MARADLSAMLGRLDEPAPNAAAAPTSTAPPARPGKAREPKTGPKASNRNQAANSSPQAPEAQGSGYLSFDRKETRLRPDQYAILTEQARRLNRAKGAGGERITENTLIRVAIDLLLTRANQLQGQDETELRNSVTL